MLIYTCHIKASQVTQNFERLLRGVISKHEALSIGGDSYRHEGMGKGYKKLPRCYSGGLR